MKKAKWCKHITWDEKLKQWFFWYPSGEKRLIWNNEDICFDCGAPRPKEEKE